MKTKAFTVAILIALILIILTNIYGFIVLGVATILALLLIVALPNE
jgi:hypothetical protein